MTTEPNAQVEAVLDARYARTLCPEERRNVRVAYGLKQSEVAALVGCSVQTVIAWERAAPRQDPQGRLAAAYGDLLRRMALATARQARKKRAVVTI
jgi:DNA-binding XRE family transcriptional regulator